MSGLDPCSLEDPQLAKIHVTTAPGLKHRNILRPYVVNVDASETGAGDVLSPAVQGET